LGFSIFGENTDIFWEDFLFIESFGDLFSVFQEEWDGVFDLSERSG
jgi:hypothetical protein